MKTVESYVEVNDKLKEFEKIQEASVTHLRRYLLVVKKLMAVGEEMRDHIEHSVIFKSADAADEMFRILKNLSNTYEELGECGGDSGDDIEQMAEATIDLCNCLLKQIEDDN